MTMRPDTSRRRCSSNAVTSAGLIAPSCAWKYNLPAGEMALMVER
jgi:hypothetical protein